MDGSQSMLLITIEMESDHPLAESNHLPL